MRAALVIAVVVVAATRVHAGKPTLAALAPAADARRAVAIGPAGQLYEPDGKGAWVRKQAGGITEEIVTVTAAGGTVIAGARGAPPFKLKGNAWTAVNLGMKARAIVGGGSRVLAAVGKTVFALDRPQQPVKLADAPSPVLALAASSKGAVIATDKGLLRLEGTNWKLIKKAPKKVRALISERWALVERGVLDLKVMKAMPLPAGVHIVEATVIADTLVAVSQHGKTVEIITIKPGGKGGPRLEREPVEVDAPKPVVGFVIDRQNRIAIAMRDGRIAWRDGATWTVSEVREELPPVKPGPAPAESQ